MKGGKLKVKWPNEQIYFWLVDEHLNMCSVFQNHLVQIMEMTTNKQQRNENMSLRAKKKKNS